MNNKSINQKAHLFYALLKKIPVAMRITLLLLFVLTCQLQAEHIYSQDTKISLDLNNSTIEKVLQTIEEKSDYYFLYNSKLIDVDRKVSVRVKNAAISAVLEKLFKSENVEFEVKGSQIILSPKEMYSQITAVAEAVQQQKKIITGTVVDAAGEPIIGANIVEVGTTNGTVTDVDGKFSLSVEPDATIRISYIGYLEQNINTAGRTNFNITLLEDTQALEEVVVVGYGVQKKETLTGSITTVKGAELIKTPTTNATHMLAGRLPGLTVVQRSGEPGADDAIIRIRGTNTLGDNNPLVVVDGVPGRSLSRIDPNSIESMTVLKDVSAAIYGAQAANGVILITTKRGAVGKPTVSVNLNQGYTQPTVIPRMANGSEYAILLNELDMYDGREPRYTEEQIRLFTSGTDPWRYPNTDWFKVVLKPWSGQNNINAQMNGGGENFRYFVSGGYKFQDAFYNNSVSNYKQYDVRVNLDTDISQHVKIGIDLYGRLQDNTSPTQGYNWIFRTTTLGSPNIHAVWPNGKPGPDIIEGRNPVIASTDAAGYDNNKTYVLNSSIKLVAQIPWIEGLSLTTSANLDKSFQNRKRWETPWEVNTWDRKTVDEDGIPVLNSAMVPFPDPRLTQYMSDGQMLLFNGVLNYDRTFNNHGLNFMVGTEAREGNGNSFNAYRRHYVSTAIPELFAGGGQDKDNSGSSYENARANFFGRMNYNYSQKYLIEFVWRYDGSYMFPQESRFGFFPGISLGYRISEEEFWKNNVPFVDHLKLRASYGQTGNDRIGEWQYLSSYGYSSNVYNFGINEEHKLLYESRIANENITWEVANQANIGFDSYLFNNKLYVEFDYFDYRRSKILWWRNASVPTTTGLSLPRENIGKVTNNGFDFRISYQDKIREFGYNIALNGGYAKNKITFWDEPPGAPEWQRSTGRPIGANLYYEAIGIFRDEAAVNAYPHWENARPGDIIFKDVNDDGVINGLDRVRIEKSDIPRFTGGLDIELSYRQFDFSVLLQGAAGAVRYLSTESGQIGNYLKDFYDKRWTPENPDSEGPRAYNRDAEYWRNNSNTYFLHKTDYIRLKNLEIGYTIPKSINNILGISNMRVYINGYNLFTFAPDFKDFDPESPSSSTSGQGQPYPAQRVINGGINITF